jgi:hypothetical protein
MKQKTNIICRQQNIIRISEVHVITKYHKIPIGSTNIWMRPWRNTEVKNSSDMHAALERTFKQTTQRHVSTTLSIFQTKLLLLEGKQNKCFSIFLV